MNILDIITCAAKVREIFFLWNVGWYWADNVLELQNMIVLIHFWTYPTQARRQGVTTVTQFWGQGLVKKRIWIKNEKKIRKKDRRTWKENQWPTGIIWSAVPLPCYFAVVKPQRIAVQQPQEGTKSCRMGRNSVHPSIHPAPLAGPLADP